ncbi:MAG: DUF2505 domain-containing protein [Actinomycetota bacterium]|nr:DUF2505 domain-containing protein [Actinomycetota bacterium]
MAQEIHRSYALPLAPLAFFDLLHVRATIENRCAAEGLGPTTLVTYETTEAMVRIVGSSDIPTSWLPSIVTSRLSGTPRVVREECWERDADSGLRSPFTFEFAGLPVRCEGSATVQPEGDESRLAIDLVLHVDVPFLGGTIEYAVAPQVAAALDAEAAFYRSL